MQVIIYPPLAYEENGELKGVAPEVVKAIQAIVGDSNPIKAAPWLRAYEATKDESMQALFAIVRIPKREKLFKWVGPIFEEGDYFFKRKGEPIVLHSLDDAKKVERIAVRKDGYTHQTLTANGFTNLDISPSYESSYRKLDEGRVDLVLMGERTYYYMLKDAGLDPTKFERTNIRFAESGAWLAFSRDIPDETIAKWQRALDSLKVDGSFDAIMEHNFRH
ncbi:substrate-binding periplasmic protein [Pseudodesulfovibrio sediminis]|uniref:ABC transporter substrate-binding protein n=1 Tax=Pseudodesulfovibrio sediminis TaxID=2810563 RepID=A0ABN6EUB9_9BACT|nr:transporter substrate-binding domain-containing protein [Pseudodesulfovibrio sediminis]BCS88468.1 ABC transporter substrate-binding protein [Pseudodesulfovibrio sediminis]